MYIMCEFECKRLFFHWNITPSNNNNNTSGKTNGKSLGDELSRKTFSNEIYKGEKCSRLLATNKLEYNLPMKSKKERVSERRRRRKSREFRETQDDELKYILPRHLNIATKCFFLSLLTTYTRIRSHIQHYHCIHYLCSKSCYNTQFCQC